VVTVLSLKRAKQPCNSSRWRRSCQWSWGRKRNALMHHQLTKWY